MRNNIFPDWEKVVRDNKKIYLDSIINRYGEENRELLSKKYDEVNFCFFETSKRLADYVKSQKRKEFIVETKEFLKEIGIDTSSIYEDKGKLFSDNIETEIKLKCLFGSNKRLSEKYVPATIADFLRDDDENEIIQNYRLMFLKKYNPSDINISDNISPNTLSKYRKMAKIYQLHLNKVIKKYYPLSKYIVELINKEEKCKTFNDEIRTYLLSEDPKILELFDDISEEIVSSMRTDGVNLSIFKIMSNLKIIILSPLYRKSNIFDLVFDHECTHILENNIYRLPNGYIVSKCGIEVSTFDEHGFQIENKYKNLNEAITQFLAIKSTLKRYSNKQYIFEHPKNDIKKIGINSSKYDKNLEKVKVLVEALPKEFINRRIEPTIDYIYDYFDEPTWNMLDNMINNDNFSLEEFTEYISKKRGITL